MKMIESLSVRGLAHITGGGLPGNACRVLPPGTALELDSASWEVPAVFRLLEDAGKIAREEMYRAFNMGIGMVIIVPAAEADTALRFLADQHALAFRIGRVTSGNGEVTIL
jgi:phosphoribosylformylglycinamidine cyclo-ligase